MAVYERTPRESAHVFSRVVDKSQVPSALTWAALGCVTASKGELNKVYQCGTTDYLASVFGEPSKDHIALVCANKIIAEDNTMFLIRVAHENSLKGAQAIVSTETVYGSSNNAIGVIESSGEDPDVKHNIQLRSLDDNKDLKNISSTLSFELDEEDEDILMSNKKVPAAYRDVYQIDSKGNKSVSNELCLLLSDVADTEKPVIVKLSDAEVELDPSKYTSNWYYGDGYAQRSVVVLSSSSGVVENRNCDVEFSVKQKAERAYGTATPNKVIVPVVLKSNPVGEQPGPGPGPEPGPEPEPVVPGVFWSVPFEVTDEYSTGN